MGEKLRVSKEEARRLTAKLSELEAGRAAMERQAEDDADVTAERVRAAGQRITELQGGENNALVVKLRDSRLRRGFVFG